MPPITASPAVTSNPCEGMSTLSENALALMRWHPAQWHAMVTIGGAVTRICRRSQRQRAVHGNFHSASERSALT
jgi:hypothetical protein